MHKLIHTIKNSLVFSWSNKIHLNKYFLTPAKKPKKWIIYTLAVYFTYALLCGLILPPKLKKIVEEELSSTLQTKCSIDKLTYNPFSLTLRVHNATIPYPLDGSQFLYIDELALSPGASTLLRLAPALGYLTITNPKLAITLEEDGSTSTLQFINDANSSETTKEKKIFPFIINNVEIRNGEIIFDDRMHNVRHVVKKLMVDVPFASTLARDKNKAMRPHLTAEINGKPITLEGRSTPFADNQKTDFTLRLGELPLSEFQPYLTPYSTLTLQQGILTAETVLHFEKENNGIDIGLSGTLYISDLAVSAPGDGIVCSADYGIIEIEHFLMELKRLSFKNFQLANPAITISRHVDGSLNWEKYLRPVPIIAQKKQPQTLPSNQNLIQNIPIASAGSSPNKKEKPITSVVTPLAKNATVASSEKPSIQPVAKNLAKSKPRSSGEDSKNLKKSKKTVSPSLVVENFLFSHGTIIWTDASIKNPPLVIAPLSIHIKNFRTDTQQPALFSLSIGDTKSADERISDVFFTEGQRLLSLYNNENLTSNNNASAGPQDSYKKRETLLTAPFPIAPGDEKKKTNATSTKTNGTNIKKIINSHNATTTTNSTSLVDTHSASLALPEILSLATALYNTPDNYLKKNPNATEFPVGDKNREVVDSMHNATTSLQVSPLEKPAIKENATITVYSGKKAGGGVETNSSLPPKKVPLPISSGDVAKNGAPQSGKEKNTSVKTVVYQQKSVQKPTPLGTFTFRGAITTAPLHIAGHLGIEGIPLIFFGGYARSLGITTFQGTFLANTITDITYTPRSSQLLCSDGSVSLKNLELLTPTFFGTISNKIKNITAGGITYDFEARRFSLSSLVINEPSTHVMLGAKLSQPSNKSRDTVDTGEIQKAKEKKETDENTFSINSITIAQGRIEVADTNKNVDSLVLSNVTTEIKGFSNNKGTPLTANAQALWNTSGKTSFDARGTITPLNMESNISLTKIPLRSFLPWLTKVTTLDIVKGTLNADAKIQLTEAYVPLNAHKRLKENKKTVSTRSMEKRPLSPNQMKKGTNKSDTINLAITGNIKATDVLFSENGEEVLSFHSLGVTRFAGNTKEKAYDIESITIDQPRLFFTLYSDGMNSATRAFDTTGSMAAKAHKKQAKKLGATTLEKAMEKAKEEANEVEKNPRFANTSFADIPQHPLLTSMTNLRIGLFSVSQGALKIKDETLPRRAQMTINDISIKGKNISSVKGSTPEFSLTAKSEGAPLTMTARINPLFTPIKGNGTVKLTGMDMVPLSPYAEKFIAYPIEKGLLSLDVTIKTDGVSLEASNAVILASLGLGQKVNTPDAPNLPIKTGLSLLADSSGNVTLSIPIKGRLDDPNFKTGGVAAKVFGNLLVKIVASPFSLLGSILGSADSSASLAYIVFAPGDDRLDLTAEKTVDTVISLLKKREKITLVLQGMADESEKEQLASTYIKKGLQVKKWEGLSRKERESTLSSEVIIDPIAHPDEYQKLLFDFYADQPFPKPKTFGITKKQPVDVMVDMITKSVPITDEALEKLAMQRAQTVLNEIIKKAPELKTRVTISESPKIREAAKNQKIFARVELGVK